MIKVGSAQVNITPPVGSRIIGQRLARIAKGIHDELYASAMVIDNGAKRVAFASCDVLSIGNRTIKAIRKEVAKETDIPEEHLFISATHTHTGPAVTSALGTNVDEAYREQFIKYVAGAVIMANDRLVDALVGMGSVDAPGWTFPRRYWMKDGTVRMHPSKTDPNIVKPEGIADTELGVFFAKKVPSPLKGEEQGEDETIAVLVNYSSHPIVVGGDVYISADYPGYIRRTIKKVTGDETVVLFGNGACGDTCPIDVGNPKRSERGHGWAAKIGLALGARAISLMAGIDPQDDLEIDVRRQIIDIPIREIPEEDLRQAEAIFAGESVTEQPTDVQKTWPRELILLHREKQKDAFAHAEIMAVRLGDGAIVGVPGEFFASLGLQIKKASCWNPTLVIELANGCVGYIPTAEAFKGGGYETELARSSKLVPSAGEKIVQTAVNLLADLGGKK